MGGVPCPWEGALSLGGCPVPGGMPCPWRMPCPCGGVPSMGGCPVPGGCSVPGGCPGKCAELGYRVHRPSGHQLRSLLASLVAE